MNELYDINSDELLHYGRKGMKWGQHIFGKVKAAAGRASARREVKRQEKAREALRKKPLRKLTDAELKDRIDRLTKEKQALDLQQYLSKAEPHKVSLGKTVISKAINDVAMPAAVNAGKEVLERWLKKKGYNIAGLKDNQYTADAVDLLSEAAKDAKNKFDKLNYERKIKETEDWFKKRAEDDVEKKIDDYIEDIDRRNEASSRKAATEKAEREAREDNKVYTGTVSGEGKSRSDFASEQNRKNEKNEKKKKNKKSKSYSGPIYSDFVDKDTPVSNVRNTESYAVGIDYMQRLLLN